MQEEMLIREAHEGATMLDTTPVYNPAGTVNTFKKNNKTHKDTYTPIKVLPEKDRSLDLKEKDFDDTYQKIVKSGLEAKREFQTKVVMPKVQEEKEFKDISSKSMVESLNHFSRVYSSGNQVLAPKNIEPAEELLLLGVRQPVKIFPIPRLGYSDADGLNGWKRLHFKTSSYLEVVNNSY